MVVSSFALGGCKFHLGASAMQSTIFIGSNYSLSPTQLGVGVGGFWLASMQVRPKYEDTGAEGKANAHQQGPRKKSALGTTQDQATWRQGKLHDHSCGPEILAAFQGLVRSSSDKGGLASSTRYY